jgi:glycosyltransferase involved in cell wall biosynthesis
MRVLFITYELPPVGGGGGRAAWQIARRLAAGRHEVVILTSYFRGLPEEEVRDGVRIRRIHVGRRRADRCPPSELFKFIWGSRRAAVHIADDLRPHATCGFFAIPGGPAAYRLRRVRGVPYVLALRGSDVPRPELARHQRLHLITRPFIRRYLRKAAGVTAVSGALKDAAQALAPRVSIEVIPNGVDAKFFTPAANAGAKAAPRDLLFVGRLRDFKRVQDVLDALPRIESALGRPARFTIVGDGPHLPALRAQTARLKREGMRSDVIFLGWRDHAALREVYRAASVVVLPSLVEGHPNVLLEGMACGVPCVASDVPGTREVVAEGGVLVPPLDPAALAGAVVDMLAHADRLRALRASARARAAAFSWDAVTARYEALLAQAGAGGGAL